MKSLFLQQQWQIMPTGSLTLLIPKNVLSIDCLGTTPCE